MDRNPKILFVCCGNAARSQMAEGFLRHLAGDRAEIHSAGLTAEGVHPQAIQVMSEVGIDISNQRSRAITDLGQVAFDLVVTLCDGARDLCRLVDPADPADSADPAGKTGPEPGESDWAARKPLFVGMPIRFHWSLEDPTAAVGDEEEVLAVFRRVRDEIRMRIEGFIGEGCLIALTAERGRTERIMDSLEDGIVVHDDSRHIYLFNRAAEKLTGRRREEVLGRDCFEVFPPDGLCGGQCAFARGSPTAEDFGEYSIVFTNKDGEEKRLKILRTPRAIEAGKPSGAVSLIRDVTEVSELRWRLEKDARESFHGMVGASPAMREIFETIRMIAASDYPVLISGESGTGKELVAHAVHQESRRRGGPFVPISCGALPEHILESELFGHVRGAFTGAIRTKKGRFELADGGTLFLDEVGELTPAFQVKLLRVVQEKRFEMVGGEKSISVDVRIISATNRDLRKLTREGSFREDLFYRLCVVPLHLPPLRERREDTPLLVEHVLGTIREESGKGIRGVSDDAIDALLAYGWPGNIRELINALQFASVRCTGEVIELRHLPPEVRHGTVFQALEPGRPEPANSQAGAAAAQAPPASGRRKKLDRETVERALAEAGGNKVRAAEALGVGRATLYRFLRDNPL